MQKLTPWFNAKKYSPAREGWYDCKECNARHYFRDGHWHRDKRSHKNGGGFMTTYNMHWRGLARPSIKDRLAQFDPNSPKSKEEQAWLDMVPVGHEFGSSDFARLAVQERNWI
jgi:hypothetical protein